MGYSIDRFLDPDIDPEFICPVCQDVLEDIVVLNCQHMFCSTCIYQWYDVSPSCPSCRQPSNPMTVNNLFRGFANIWERLKIECKYTSLGCNSIINLGELTVHENNCIFNPENCIICTSGCGTYIKPQDIINHDCLTHVSEQYKIHTDELQELVIKQHKTEEILIKTKLQDLKLQEEKLIQLRDLLKKKRDLEEATLKRNELKKLPKITEKQRRQKLRKFKRLEKLHRINLALKKLKTKEDKVTVRNLKQLHELKRREVLLKKLREEQKMKKESAEIRETEVQKKMDRKMQLRFKKKQLEDLRLLRDLNKNKKELEELKIKQRNLNRFIEML